MEFLIIVPLVFVGYEAWKHWDEFVPYNPRITNNNFYVLNNYSLNSNSNPKIIYRSLSSNKDFNGDMKFNSNNIGDNLDYISNSAIQNAGFADMVSKNNIFVEKDSSNDGSQYIKTLRKDSIQLDVSYATDLTAMKLKYDVIDPDFQK